MTITRLFGAGGSDVAARAAALLGWTLLDDALADRVAAQLGLTVEEVRFREERSPSLAARVADALAMSAPEVRPMGGEYVTPPVERMLAIARKVMNEVAAQGPVVIVGRGAAAVFAGRPDALHVFCYAPRDALIRRVMSRDDLTFADAARKVYDTNRAREQAMLRVYHRDWRAVEHYHLCLNTDWLGVELAASAVAQAARERL
ncbi:MAG TPA: cytidylate kinase-like family protein [Gemmatimonadaceae bacterium]|nr:cytidylate kinase-like family protein [Gemmatimonadaceae bacterium]